VHDTASVHPSYVAVVGPSDPEGPAIADAAREEASPGHAVVVPTGLGEMRNAPVVRSADAVLAVGGGWGTLSEIALAARAGVPVAAVASWDLPEPAVVTCSAAAEAVAVLERLGR
jgi:uncharacterized protein (TIGR00725 family)